MEIDNINEKFEYIGHLPNGISRVKSNGKWGIVDKSGKNIFPVICDEIMSLAFSNGLIGVKIGGKWGFINRDGSKIIEEQYDDVYPFYGKYGISKVKKNDFWGLINKTGEEITSISYKSIEMFGKGFALKNENDKWEFYLTSNPTNRK